MYLFENICSLNLLNIYFLIPIIVVMTILLVSCIYDLKLGIVPNNLSKLLIVFGIIYNLFLGLIFSNYYFLINAIILGLIIFIISLCLWKIKFWGGGDLKLFLGMAISLAYFSSPLFISLNCMNFMNQNFFYFPIISVLFNSILISFPFILIYLFIKFLSENFNMVCQSLEKELKLTDKNNYYSKFLLYFNLIKFFIFNFTKVIHSSSSKKIHIKNLKEGMVLDNYFFYNKDLYDIINFKEYNDKDDDNNNYLNLSNNQDLNNYINLNIDLNNINLSSKYISNSFSNESYNKEYDSLYCIKSANGAGLTKDDIYIINYCFDNEIIKNKEFIIKVGIPFCPSLMLGFIIFIIFGDLINIISQCLYNLI